MKSEPLNIYGYSERGMVNALCYEMRHSTDGLRLLREFLNLFTFPFSRPDFEGVQSATFIIEQSFSDFGDLDLLILLNGTKKQAVLLEAKVKTSQTNEWSIASQWAAFCDLPKAVAKTSNLFMQLYRKMRLIHRIRYSEALRYSERMPKTRLGENKVVNTAVKLLGEYCSETWFAALIPDSTQNAQQLFETELCKPIADLPDWDFARMGFLSWADLKRHCVKQRSDWSDTLASFEYNKEQIYGSTDPNVDSQLPPPGSLVSWKSGAGLRTGVIKRRGRHNTRVILSDGESEKVPNSELIW